MSRLVMHLPPEARGRPVVDAPFQGSPRWALLALAAGGFAIGTGEFLTIGLLPTIAASQHVTIPAAGRLISAYAIGVVVGAPLLIAATARLSRKTVLGLLLLAFAAGNVLSALAPTYRWLIVARFLSGVPHGAFFGVGSVVASSLVETNRRAKAMSFMFAGVSVSVILGVPAVTLLGQQAGWRVAFVIVAGMGTVAAVAALIAVPDNPGSRTTLKLGAELRSFQNPQVLLALLIATVGCSGLFATFTYVTPMLTHLARYTPGQAAVLFIIFGLGLTFGNIVGARMADKSLMRSLLTFLTTEAILAVILFLTVRNKISAPVTIFLFAATSIAIVPTLQNRIILQARDAPSLASASIQSAFNIGNALGAWLGGVAIAAGFGYASPNLVAAGLACIGLMLAICSQRLDLVSSQPIASEARR